MIYQNKYIPLFVIAFLLLNSILVKAQSIEDVKKKDTVFILFEQSKKFKEYTYNGGDIFKDCHKYTYYYSNSDYIVFTCCRMLDFDREALITTVKKRWLKKQLIITKDFLKKMGIIEANRILYSKKLFIIEAKDYKKRKVLSKQATLSSSYIPGGNDSLIQYEEIKN